MSEWIPVGERLPVKGDRVVIISDDRDILAAFIDFYKGDMQWWTTDGWFQTEHVIYWTPLPKLPGVTP